MLNPELTSNLAESGWAVQPEWLSTSDALDLLQFAQSTARTGGFRRAGIGNASTGGKIEDGVRRDEIRWLDRTTAAPAEKRLLERLETLRLELNRELFAGLHDFEVHFARYPAGGFYRRHVDRFRADDARAISMVIYLNPDWTAADGGELHLFPPGRDVVRVEPRLGTTALFMSDSIEHEVQATTRERWSLACWFRRAPRSMPT